MLNLIGPVLWSFEETTTPLNIVSFFGILGFGVTLRKSDTPFMDPLRVLLAVYVVYM